MGRIMIIPSAALAFGALVIGHAMGYHEIVLRWAELILSWEVLGFILGVTILVKYKEAICGLIDRIVGGKVGRVQFEATPQERRSGASAFDAETDLPTPDSKKDLGAVDTEKLIKNYARLWQAYKFERMFHSMYGSQIKLVDRLASKGDDGEAWIKQHGFYEEFVSQSGNTSYLFGSYMGFLVNSGLIEQIGTHAEPVVRVTQEGRDFLEYVTMMYSSGFAVRPW